MHQHSGARDQNQYADYQTYFSYGGKKIVRVDTNMLLGVTNHWTGLDWNPKICFYALWDAISIK